ncbi:hypothetical protein ON010_g2729 [Phytophthora cinnamomi]|nr:hypothetical protein ON010_g2729 [Phytophthora cinnamomi]
MAARERGAADADAAGRRPRPGAGRVLPQRLRDVVACRHAHHARVRADAAELLAGLGRQWPGQVRALAPRAARGGLAPRGRAQRGAARGLRGAGEEDGEDRRAPRQRGPEGPAPHRSHHGRQQTLRQAQVRRGGEGPLRRQQDARQLYGLVHRRRHHGAHSVRVFNGYGARDEIVGACKKIAKEVASGQTSVEEINEELLSQRMLTAYRPARPGRPHSHVWRVAHQQLPAVPDRVLGADLHGQNVARGHAGRSAGHHRRVQPPQAPLWQVEDAAAVIDLAAGSSMAAKDSRRSHTKKSKPKGAKEAAPKAEAAPSEPPPPAKPAAPPPLSPRQQSPIHRRASYSWDDVEVAGGRENLLPPPSQQQPKHLRFYQQPQRDESKYRRSASAGSTNGQSDGNASERNYRQSNLVPAKVWERAMEDVAIHGMSLRNAAKAHGVHFAALHRRLKKRQQHKLSTPCEPNYIPFEDEAGIVRVIHARAEMGVLMTFTELVDLLRRTALKHRSELPDEISTALVRKFQSRVEQSIRHLVIDWPALPSNVLYRLRDTSSAGDDAKDGMIAGVAAVNVGKSSGPSIISARSGEGGSLSSSGSSSSLSPHPQVAAVFPAIRKSPVATAPAPAWSSKARSGANSMGADSSSGGGNNSNVNGINDPTAATVPPPSDEKEAAPSMILRL